VLVVYDATSGSKPGSKNADKDNFERYAAKYPRIAADPDTFEATLVKIEEYVKQHGKIIDLRIYGHGMPDGTTLLSPKVDLRSVLEKNPDYIRRLGKCIASNGGIGLYGCNGGKDIKHLENLGKEMPHIYCIRATTEDVWWPIGLLGFLGPGNEPRIDFDVQVYPYMNKKSK
jgi:hypothetical protein